MLNKKDKGSLIICATPLQVLIAERIIDLHPEEEFYAMILVDGALTQKMKYYADRLIAKCNSRGLFFRDNISCYSRPVAKVFRFIQYGIKGIKFNSQINKVYVCSYEYLSLRMFLGFLCKDTQWYSFDDGFLNLLPKRFAEHKKDQSGLVLDLLRVPKTSSIMKKILGHYTIYDIPNAAYPSATKITLFDFKDESILSESEVIRLCLGQPIFELDGTTEDNKQVTQKLISLTGCDKYLPHPRENYLVEGVEYINTPYIAEDYILQELDKYPNRCYELVSFFTTSLINLLGHPRISVKAYKPHNVPQRWEECYTVLEKLGVPIMILK